MFHKCSSEEEAKKLFRRLALRLHPDAGGDSDLMILLQEWYEYSREAINESSKKQEKETKWSGEKYHKSYENIYSGDERLHIIVEIFAYSDSHKKFDPSMTESINEYLSENGYITSAQYNALVRVYYAFRMDQKKEKNANP